MNMSKLKTTSFQSAKFVPADQWITLTLVEKPGKGAALLTVPGISSLKIYFGGHIKGQIA